jgi:hypothetical protein
MGTAAKPPPSQGGGKRSDPRKGKRRSLRNQWAEITLERKLGLFIAPVIVALISGFAVPLLLRATSRHGKVAGLSVAAVEIASSSDPKIDLTLSNRGKTVAVVGRVDLKVLVVRRLRYCAGPLTANPPAYINDTHIYDFELPGRPATVRIDTRQEVRPNGTDAFSLSPLNGVPDLTLYQLQVFLYHDGLVKPIDAGKVILSPTFAGEANVAPPAKHPKQARCLAHNRGVLRSILSLDGQRSRELRRLRRKLG